MSSITRQRSDRCHPEVSVKGQVTSGSSGSDRFHASSTVHSKPSMRRYREGPFLPQKKKTPNAKLQVSSKKDVGVTGLEPATSWSQTRCATNCATPRAAAFDESAANIGTFALMGKKTRIFLFLQPHQMHRASVSAVRDTTGMRTAPRILRQQEQGNGRMRDLNALSVVIENPLLF